MASNASALQNLIDKSVTKVDDLKRLATRICQD